MANLSAQICIFADSVTNDEEEIKEENFTLAIIVSLVVWCTIAIKIIQIYSYHQQVNIYIYIYIYFCYIYIG